MHNNQFDSELQFRIRPKSYEEMNQSLEPWDSSIADSRAEEQKMNGVPVFHVENMKFSFTLRCKEFETTAANESNQVKAAST